MTPGYPFSAIVGQQALLEALLVNAVSPQVGGVLVRGERGTAKSTAVRALAPLLPAVLVAADQPFCFGPGDLAPDGPVDPTVVTEPRPAPLVELPVGATIDRLVGALDLGRALAGERAFEAGLLARAHQGVLYVDEVNLLPDHLVDVLLDAAAMGVCHVERDAVSVRHDSRFLLVGTMNAEEGELRPQLLDRFGLGVEVRAPTDPEIRAEIVRRRLAYEADPVAFALAYVEADADVAARIVAARERLPRVRLSERELGRIVRACAQVGVDGMRGDLVTARAARVLAALEACDEVSAEHVRRAAHLALVHRRRRDPLDGAATDSADVDRALDEDGEPPEEPPSSGGNGRAGGRDQTGGTANGSAAPSDLPASVSTSASRDDLHAADAPSETREATDLAAPAPRERLDAPERALSVALPEPRGRGAGARAGASARATGRACAPIDSVPSAGDDDLALVATLRERLLTGDPQALRRNVRAGREGALLCLVVDASGSMGARRRMARVKGALLGLLRDAYARRDRVAIVSFRDARAQVVHPPGAPLQDAARAVRDLHTGGRTPLAAGLDTAAELIRRERSRDPSRRALAVVLTDGRALDRSGAVARAAAALGRMADAVHVIDTEEGPARLGLARALAAAAGAQAVPLPGMPAPRRRVGLA
ncbi:MAG: magnesium chelatase subunit [Solirubrobacteraceae bacterium]|jgi:magnesium chelatase subunit D|nr:magnesium chelatase subunit [Solirubrobacteraceae bacterium]